MFKLCFLTLSALTALAVFPANALADGEETEGPVYQRHRQAYGEDATQFPQGSYGQPSYPGYFPGAYYPGYYYPKAISGSWYQRPYPYHFDFYKGRYSARSATSGGQPVRADGPCAEPQATH